MTYEECLQNLKQVKQEYLQSKLNSNLLRDLYLSQSEDKERRVIWQKEKNELYWKSLRKYFCHKRMNTIHSVEYISYGKTIRVLGQIQVENTIFIENTKQFIFLWHWNCTNNRSTR